MVVTLVHLTLYFISLQTLLCGPCVRSQLQLGKPAFSQVPGSQSTQAKHLKEDLGLWLNACELVAFILSPPPTDIGQLLYTGTSPGVAVPDQPKAANIATKQVTYFLSPSAYRSNVSIIL